jgi:hypothetical protein
MSKRMLARHTSRLLAELHCDSLYPMMGKDAWVAGADRGEAPGLKPVRLGRRLRLRRQPPGPWQLWNGGVQRGVSIFRVDLNGNNQPRPEAVVLGRPPRGGRLREVAPVGGVELERSRLSPRHRQRLLR